MVAQREAKAEEERLRKKAAADAAFKAVVEQTEKQNNEEDELRVLRYTKLCTPMSDPTTPISSTTRLYGTLRQYSIRFGGRRGIAIVSPGFISAGNLNCGWQSLTIATSVSVVCIFFESEA